MYPGSILWCEFYGHTMHMCSAIKVSRHHGSFESNVIYTVSAVPDSSMIMTQVVFQLGIVHVPRQNIDLLYATALCSGTN